MDGNKKRLFEMMEKVNKISLKENFTKNVEFEYDNKGNYLPKGYENKRIGIRPIVNNDSYFMIVHLDENGEIESIDPKNYSWMAAKELILNNIF